MMMRLLLTTGLAVLCLSQASDARARKRKAAPVRPPVADTLPEGFFAPESSYSGKTTYYRNVGRGSCSFPAGDVYTAAMNRHQYAKASLCGSCIEATGPKGSVIARVIDICPGCPPGGVDLSQEAFARIAPLSMGRATVRWKFAECPNDTQMTVHRMGKKDRGQISLQVRRHAVPLKSVEVLSDTGWMRLQRQSYNRFVGRGFPSAPWTLRLTDAWDRSVTDSGVTVANEGVVPLSVRFPGIPRRVDSLLVRRDAGQDLPIPQ